MTKKSIKHVTKKHFSKTQHCEMTVLFTLNRRVEFRVAKIVQIDRKKPQSVQNGLNFKIR